MTYNIILPDRTGTPATETLTTDNNIVLIGANGSGKSRLGVWIEQIMQNQITVHRISAQKALNIPSFASLKSLEQAEKGLLFGRDDEHASIARKIHDRWGNSPFTYLLNDFDQLLSLLFAKSAERDRQHTAQTKVTQAYVIVPDAPIDIIVRIWSDIMPHRQISFNDGKVLGRKEGELEYHGKEMSDGERVSLYLIGQCLCAPNNSLIIIDEPEIHLHKSIVDKLWNKVEELSQNKLLIYITHDLDFASSREDANKFWIKSYNGNNSWEWAEVPEDMNLPDGLILEILGSRKNIIFCEGENGSLDTTIYQLVYPEYHIIPRGSGHKVIEATKALRNNENIHHLNVYGLIDSDYKEEEEKQVLRNQGIFTISVAEIENLFCIEPVLRIIAEHLELDPDQKVNEVIDFLINSLNAEFDLQVSSKAEKIIEYKLGAYSKEANSEQGLADGLTTTLGRIDIPAIYAMTRIKFQDAINERHLNKLLLIYNRKSLTNRISGIFGLGHGQYDKLLVRLIKGSRKEALVQAIKQCLPQIA
jgi:energy-coupling factor transporter ATP-binding protein EcfA2